MAETKKTTKTVTKKETEKKTTKVAKKEEPKKAETKKAPAKKEQKKTSSTTHISSEHWSLAKVAFVIIIAVAVLYLVNSLLAILGIGAGFVTALQAVCSAAALAVVGFVGWGYVKNRKNGNLQVLYFIALVLVLVGIVIPAIF